MRACGVGTYRVGFLFVWWWGVNTHSCHVGDEGVYALAAAVSNAQNTIEDLDLGCNGFGSDAVAALGVAIGSGHLRSLGLRNDDLRPGDVPALCARFGQTGLRALDLRKNKLGDAGVTLLARALTTDESVTSIDLRSNSVTSVGLRELALALGDNVTVVELDLGMTAEDAPEIGYIEALLSKNLMLERQRLAIERLRAAPHRPDATLPTAFAASFAAARRPEHTIETATPADTSAESCAPAWSWGLASGAALAAAVGYIVIKRPGCPAAYA